MRTFKSFFVSEDQKEPVQPWDPRSKGEQNFKHLHNPVDHKNLVPGVTDQDHVFNGGERRYDPPTASYEKGADVTEYDKGLTTEATLSAKAGRAGKDLGKPGKNFDKIAVSAGKEYGSKEAGERVAGAILKKMHAKRMHEELEHLDEADLTKIDRKTLEALTQLHKHYGQKDPRSKESAERGEAELKRRDNEKKEKMKESTLPPHLAKMFNAKGDFKDPKKHAIYKGIQDRLANKDLGVDAKDHKSEYGKMRASMGVDDKATTRKLVGERTLTPLEMKKREQIAKAMGRENPKMGMSKKMAIATAQAKKMAEEVKLDEKMSDETKSKINSALGKKTPSNDMRKTTKSARELIALSKLKKESLELDEARGRPKKSGEEAEGGREHIIVQYRKNERSPDNPVEHADKSKATFPREHYKKALDMHVRMTKPSDKESFERELDASPERARNAVAGKPAPAPAPKVSLGGTKRVGGVKEMRDPTTTRADKGTESEETYRDSNGVLHVKKRTGVSKEVKIGESKELNAKNVKAAVKHDCATHVKHAKFGEGRCVPEMHTIVEISEGVGYVSHYDVMFEHGIEQNVPVGSLKILASEEHGHMPKKSMKEALVGNQDKIDANHNGEIDKEDFTLLKNKNKFKKFSKKKVSESVEVNMQQDSIDKLKSDPLAGEELKKAKLPPTQGNKSLGGDENPARVGGKYSMEEQKLTALYNSLSEENQVKFEAMFETIEGIEQLIRFAEIQGIE
jgi:hypothetical protein